MDIKVLKKIFLGLLIAACVPAAYGAEVFNDHKRSFGERIFPEGYLLGSRYTVYESKDPVWGIRYCVRDSKYADKVDIYELHVFDDPKKVMLKLTSSKLEDPELTRAIVSYIPESNTVTELIIHERKLSGDQIGAMLSVLPALRELTLGNKLKEKAAPYLIAFPSLKVIYEEP
jgi:hypothetical protein